MHTAPLIAPVAKPWAVVAVHVRSELVGDAYLASVRFARAVARHPFAKCSTVKLQSAWSYEMQEPIPPPQDLPPLEDLARLECKNVQKKKVHELKMPI